MKYFKVRKMAQVVKYLEDLSLDLQNPLKLLGLEVWYCDPSGGEIGSRDRQIPGSPGAS